MLGNFRIQNFKGWKETGVIGLVPVTVLFRSRFEVFQNYNIMILEGCNEVKRL